MAGHDARATGPEPELHRWLRTTVASAVQERDGAYVVTGVSFEGGPEITLSKDAASFVVWLKPAGDAVRFFRRTTRFKLGYRGKPDASGLDVLDAICRRIEAEESSLEVGVEAAFFASPRPNPDVSVEPAVRSLLSEAAFTPVHEDWVHARDRLLQKRFEELKVTRGANVLLVNATKGLQFYPSIVDFFARLHHVHDALRVTSASYFDELYELHQGVVDRGLPVVPVTELNTWGPERINSYDVILFVGPSDAMFRIMSLPEVTARLVMLDLAFYHQLIDAWHWPPGALIRVADITREKSQQRSRVIAYSCQHEEKVFGDLSGVCALQLFDWRWFNYIPIGFAYRPLYRADRRTFDLALLGSAGRDYGQLAPDRLRGLRLLALGVGQTAELDRLRGSADVTSVSGVDEDTYARLLALCRTVVLPMRPNVRNAFLSVVDAVASGKPMVTPRHPGLARLEREGLPAVFYDGTTKGLHDQLDAVLGSPVRLDEIEAASVAFVRERMDVYGVLTTILTEQLL
jgi:hypothetical protein